MTRIVRTSLILIAAAVGVVAIGRLAMPRLAGSVAGGVVMRDGARALADCPGTPNCRSSMSDDADHAVDALPGAGSATASLDALEAVLANEPGAQVMERNGNFLHATFGSRVMNFTDDVEFLVDPAGERIDVRSASRLGKSDLGANGKRIERLRDALRARSPESAGTS